jgi:hypothetical protein
MDEYEIYESECKKIREENRQILDGFRQYLGLKKLSEKPLINMSQILTFI